VRLAAHDIFFRTLLYQQDVCVRFFCIILRKYVGKIKHTEFLIKKFLKKKFLYILQFEVKTDIIGRSG